MVAQPGREEAQERPWSTSQYLKEANKEAGDGLFTGALNSLVF